MAKRDRLAAGSDERRARAEHILDVTAELLLRHGYKRVTIDDVAAGAGIGKGTVYLHWRTREALFWAVLQRETMRMLEQILAGLAADPALALPSRLMPAIFLAASERPLVLAVLLNDAELLGGLARDGAVAAAQKELSGNDNYLDLLAARGLLRDGLTPATAGYVLGSVMRGFFAAADASPAAGASPGAGTGGARTGRLPVTERASLLADVLHRSLEPDDPPPADAVIPLAGQVAELFTAIVTVQRAQLERAYG
jgi:AcrR family transcriptional regulator